ncbi:MAG: hypothetical protein RLZZ253_1320, partial [Verrucomicrobiota bacterium]
MKLLAHFLPMNLPQPALPRTLRFQEPRRPAYHRMKHALLCLGFLTALNSPADAVPHPVLEEKHRAFLKDNCLNCHNADKQKGKVRLDDISFSLDAVQKADLWQKILNAVNSGEMPPEDEKQPERGQKTEFLAALSETLV